ncbi:hypothetical protein ASPBRDRAFT_59065 [Aspergillus brasiliensis CBS 101740]|uniref:Dienelactone hydrolase domain-containing protein n=1 Tax=Aspergillus brasiliensis (strain CBS 101740 / IMI 381727 / IBT 21946) TaxID=767769 RepID=A0A1L9U5V8_ASPBC|nr:hypothetical protein ASPBRDRAFT_59065 [Aspergillus brasiliensis CBS 101740]
MSDCCLNWVSLEWHTPRNCYRAGAEFEVAVLLIHDLFRWAFTQRSTIGGPSGGRAAIQKLIRELETQQIGVPVQIMAPGHDSQAFNNVVLPTLGVPYQSQYFPSSSHGFATPGKLNEREKMWDAERAKDAAVLWFHHWLRKQRKQN